MFERFLTHFQPDAPLDLAAVEDGIDLPPEIAPFVSRFGGMSFNGGLYRIIRASDMAAWQRRIDAAFPAFSTRVICFGYDWLGRAFVTDLARSEGGRPAVLLLDAGAAEALQIPANIETFHNDEVVEFAEAAFAVSFYDRWLKLSNLRPAYSECIGYKLPLFFGGEDELENLETSDLDVYWHIFGQASTQIGANL